jgi:hypothetical protein
MTAGIYCTNSMTAPELLEMADALEIPDPFFTESRYEFTAIEALALLCTQFRSPADQFDMSTKYCCCQLLISELTNELVEFVDDTWAHLLDYNHDHLLSPANLAHYADAVCQARAPINTFWGSIDCTIHQICQPTFWQRQAYCGHKKYHALKFQAITIPSRSNAHLFPQEGH